MSSHIYPPPPAVLIVFTNDAAWSRVVRVLVIEAEVRTARLLRRAVEEAGRGCRR